MWWAIRRRPDRPVLVRRCEIDAKDPIDMSFTERSAPFTAPYNRAVDAARRLSLT
jgi:hypothetical protein